MTKVAQLVFGNEHEPGRDEQDAPDPGQHYTQGHKHAEDLNRRDRRQRQRGETGGGGQRSKQHRPEQRAHHGTDGLLAIAVLLIAVEGLRKDMHRVEHCDRHDEDRDHRTHDVDGVAGDHQQCHGRQRRDHGDDHRRNHQHQIAKEPPHQSEDDQHRKWRGDRHLVEHLDAERVLGHRQSGDVNLVLLGPVRSERQQVLANVPGNRLGRNRQVQRQRPAVGGTHRAVEHRDPAGPGQNLAGLLAIFRRLGHQPGEAHLARAILLDVVDVARCDQVDTHDLAPHLRISRVRVLQRHRVLSQCVNASQAFRIEHTVRINLVDDAHDDHVVEAEASLGLVVKLPNRFIFGQHVLRVGVDLERVQHRKALRPDAGQCSQRDQHDGQECHHSADQHPARGRKLGGRVGQAVEQWGGLFHWFGSAMSMLRRFFISRTSWTDASENACLKTNRVQRSCGTAFLSPRR